MNHVRLDLLLLIWIQLNYYPYMIILNKCNGSCNVVDDLSTKICVPNKTKDIDVKVFDMITIIYESKALVKRKL